MKLATRSSKALRHLGTCLVLFGFSKEMDINSASPDQLAPLPFHGMGRYPYRWPEHYPLDKKHREYIEKYNTRIVGAQVPSIEVEAIQR